RLYAKRGADGVRGFGRSFSFGEQSRAMNVRGEVTITEVEPVGAAIEGEALECVKCFPAKTPAFCGIDDARKGVGHDIEIGRDLQAVKNNIVAGVYDDGHRARVHDVVEAQE